MKKRSPLVWILFLFLSSCSYPAQLHFPAPSVLVNTDRSMHTPGFWISRQLAPDQIILDEQKIAEFNSRLREQRLITDITQLPQKLTGRDVKIELKNEYAKFSKGSYFLMDGSVAGEEFFKPISANMDFYSFGKVWVPRYGFITHYANQRLLPTDDALLEKKGDVDFDELQNSALDIATPIAILYESSDGKWVYCSSEASSGWVKKEFVAFVDLPQIQEAEGKPFVVVTAAKADIFLDAEMKQHYDYAQMGTRLIFAGEARPGVIKLSLALPQGDGAAQWQDAYARAEDVHVGYLDYTSRNIVIQAFKLLNAPYGWGGMYGEQDCSRFLQQIFSTAGIRLPRNSGSQAKAGQVIARFDEKTSGADKIKILKTQADPGITLLGMKGHIMLYLGEVGGRPYAIHATWAYRQMQGSQEITWVINKVTVSDLSLGQGARKGSLLERLKAVTVVKK